jgi:hypothetical protein
MVGRRMMARPRIENPSKATLRSRRRAERERAGLRVIPVEVAPRDIDHLAALGLVGDVPDDGEIGLAIKILVNRTRAK